MKQPTGELLTGRGRIIDMLAQDMVEVSIGFTGAAGQPLSWVPTGVKFSGTKHGLQSFRFGQGGIEDGTAYLQMRIQRLARNEETHDLARSLENRVDPAIAQKSFHSNGRFATAGERIGRFI